MSTPVQSLTSLDWYRQALAESAPGRRFSWVRWFRGVSFLLSHFSFFVLSIVALFAIDLIRSPGSLWIDKVALAWAALIVIHAAIVGLIWAFGLLREDQPVEQLDELRWSAGPTAAGWRTNHAEPQDADFRMSAQNSGPDATVVSPPPVQPLPPKPAPNSKAAATPLPFDSWAQPESKTPAPIVTSNPNIGQTPATRVDQESPWSGWEPASPATIARQALEGDGSGDRASWTEASAAAWLTRTPTSGNASNAASTESDTFKNQLRARLERRNAGRVKDSKPDGINDSGTPSQ